MECMLVNSINFGKIDEVRPKKCCNRIPDRLAFFSVPEIVLQYQL